ncbi:putative zinc finger protein [Apostichopus japonicus]|uniref:Putative zinc finger protein n=1 Tax=Stichopus japonicus TaxID=307972 RepID=A0A2G8KXA6_STIJA|nr:putative zinc finger protein [Apostichopus japonicus]
MEGEKDSEEIHKPAESNDDNHNPIWIQQTHVKETCQGSDDSQSVPKSSEETVVKDVDMPSQAKDICPSNTTPTGKQCEEYIETDSLGIDDCFQQNKACESEAKNPKQLELGRETDILDVNETCQRDNIVGSGLSSPKQFKENQDTGQQSSQVRKNVNEWITPVATQEEGLAIKPGYDGALLANDGDIGEGNGSEEQSIVTNEVITVKHNEDIVEDFEERTEQLRNVEAVVTSSHGEKDVTSEDRGVGGRGYKTAEKEKCSESEYLISSDSNVQNSSKAITSDTHQQEGKIVKLAMNPDLQTQKLVKDGNQQTLAHKRAHLERLIGSRLLGYHPQFPLPSSSSPPHLPPPPLKPSPSFQISSTFNDYTALVLDSVSDPTLIRAGIEGSIPRNIMTVYPVEGDLSQMSTVPAMPLHQQRKLPQSFLGISKGACDEIYGPLLHAVPAMLHQNRSSTHLTNLTKAQLASSSITNVNHLKVHETEGLLECKFCRETWQTKEELEAHEQKHVNDKIYSCLVCDKSFNCSSMLKRHKNTHIPKDPFPCKFCGRLFVRAHNLAIHEKIHEGDLPYQCKYCDKAFATESYLTIHEKAHTQQNFFKCSFCGKTFYLYGIYKRHEKIHAGKTPHPCELCYKVFDSGEALKLHLASHEHLRPYKCTQCDKAYNQEKNLKRHIKVHTDVKPYRCQYCEMSFHFKSHCVSHEVTHTGKNPFQCELCDKGFKRQCTLTIHQRVHTGEKPYQCQTCKKTFRQRSTLKSHEISHSTEKPYGCTYCDKTFAYHINLKRHVRVHTNERPYPCRLCKKRFKLLPHLSKHMRIHGEDRPYVCGVCGKGFHQSNSLKKHEKRHAV